MNPVVVDMPEHNGGNMGGTMRLGKRRTEFNTEDSILRKFFTVMTYTITRCTLCRENIQIHFNNAI